VVNWYFPKNGKPHWGSPEPWDITEFGDDWGPAPLQPGCYVSRDLVLKWLSEALKAEDGAKLLVGDDKNNRNVLSDEMRKRLPVEHLTEEARAVVAEGDVQRAYLLGLSAAELSARRDVLRDSKFICGDLDEATLRENTRELVEYRASGPASGYTSWSHLHDLKQREQWRRMEEESREEQRRERMAAREFKGAAAPRMNVDDSQLTF
jgi:hypothetical protein